MTWEKPPLSSLEEVSFSIRWRLICFGGKLTEKVKNQNYAILFWSAGSHTHTYTHTQNTHTHTHTHIACSFLLLLEGDMVLMQWLWPSSAKFSAFHVLSDVVIFFNITAWFSFHGRIQPHLSLTCYHPIHLTPMNSTLIICTSVHRKTIWVAFSLNCRVQKDMKMIIITFWPLSMS